MRFPLRFQLLLPLIIVSLASLLAHALVYARLATRQTQDRIDTQLQGVARVLSESNFPLTPAVLQQMKSLSGAEFIVSDFAGRIGLSTLDTAGPTISTGERVSRFDQVTVSRPMKLGESQYHYASVELSTRPSRPQALVLHILFPRDDYLVAWRSAFYPPLWIGLATVGGIALVVLVFAARISRTANKLGSEIERLAAGDFAPLEPPALDDELRDLALNVNQTASRLADYEDKIRRTEQLRTLSLLGAGLAHEMRNAATGCRLAVDLHSDSCPIKQDESLDVARRQLQLMETRLQRFLSLGKSNLSPQHDPIDLQELVEGLLPLVRPMAAHAQVRLEWNPGDLALQVMGSADMLGQGVLNVVTNGIEAAQQAATMSPDATPEVKLFTQFDVATQEVTIEISDTGLGPPPHLREALFEPFATTRPEGVGLGLAVAREAMLAHGGSIDWRRDDDRTVFTLRLPCHSYGSPHDSSADRR